MSLLLDKYKNTKSQIKNGTRNGIVYQTRIIYDGEVTEYKDIVRMPYGKGRVILPNGLSFEGVFGKQNNYLLLSNDGLFYIGGACQISEDYPIYWPHGYGITRDISGTVIHEGVYFMGIRKNNIAWLCSDNLPMRQNGQIKTFTPLFYHQKNYVLLPVLCVGNKPWYAENIKGHYFTDPPLWSETSGKIKYSNNVQVAIPGLTSLRLTEDDMFLATVHPSSNDAVRFYNFDNLTNYYKSLVAPDINAHRGYAELIKHIIAGFVKKVAGAYVSGVVVGGTASIIPDPSILAAVHTAVQKGVDFIIEKGADTLFEIGMDKYEERILTSRSNSVEMQYIKYIEYLSNFPEKVRANPF